jgi:hypothetical protein
MRDAAGRSRGLGRRPLPASISRVHRRPALLATVVLRLGISGWGSGASSTRKAVTRLPSPTERRAGLKAIARRVMKGRAAPASEIRCVLQNIAATGLGQLMKQEETLRYPSSKTPLEFIVSFAGRCGRRLGTNRRPHHPGPTANPTEPNRSGFASGKREASRGGAIIGRRRTNASFPEVTVRVRMGRAGLEPATKGRCVGPVRVLRLPGADPSFAEFA